MRTPLHSATATAGAQFHDFYGWEIPGSFGSLQEEYEALKQAAGIVDLASRGKVAVTGDDRQIFLHRMLTNEVKGLDPGEGNYCFLLDPQGHILADMNLLKQRERVLLDCEPFVTGKLVGHLSRFVVAAKVKLEDVSARLGTIGVEGPLSREVVCPVLGLEPPHMKPLDHFSLEGDPDLVLVRAAVTGEGLWLLAPVERLRPLWDRLVEAARPLGGRPVGVSALEVARIEAGLPRYDTDIEEKNIPQETGQFRALSFSKGCYPGQEIVERVRSRGHVNRKLVGLIAPGGETLRPGMQAQEGDREIGRITSAAYSPGAGRWIALGYLRRELAEPGIELSVDGVTVQVVPLPFPRA